MTKKLLNKIFSTTTSVCMLLVPFQAVSASKEGAICKGLHSEKTVPLVRENRDNKCRLRRCKARDLSEFRDIKDSSSCNQSGATVSPMLTHPSSIGKCKRSNVSVESIIPSSPENSDLVGSYSDGSKSQDNISDGMCALTNLWYNYIIYINSSQAVVNPLDRLSFNKIQVLLNSYEKFTSGYKGRNEDFRFLKINNIKTCIHSLLAWFDHLKLIGKISDECFLRIKSECDYVM